MNDRIAAAHAQDCIDIDAMLASALSCEEMPTFAQDDLVATFASLDAIPQTSAAQPVRGSGRQQQRRWRKPVLILAAALTAALVAGGAVAATRLLSMGEGDGSFFASGKHLPVYDSMRDSSLSMSAAVDQTVEIGGLQVTLDSISCDRNIANLYLTVEKPGGIDLAAELGSRFGDDVGSESAWSNMRMLLPDIIFETHGVDGSCSGIGRLLDAYIEDGAIKALVRIVPERMLSEQVDLRLDISVLTSGYATSTASMTVGLDLSDVHPREIAPQTVTFQTSQGERRLEIERFVASDLGTVLVLANHTEVTYRIDGHPNVYAEPSWMLKQSELKFVDDTGAMLRWVDPGDSLGYDPSAPRVIELTGISPEAQSVTITPMLDPSGGDPQAVSLIESYEVDAQHLPTTLPQSSFGGYELTAFDIAEGVATYQLEPYGWLPFGVHPAVTPVDTSGVQPNIGGCLQTMKHDYRSGDLVVMYTYYTATDDQIARAGWLRSSQMKNVLEETGAAQTLLFTEWSDS